MRAFVHQPVSDVCDDWISTKKSDYAQLLDAYPKESRILRKTRSLPFGMLCERRWSILLRPAAAARRLRLPGSNEPWWKLEDREPFRQWKISAMNQRSTLSGYTP